MESWSWRTVHEVHHCCSESKFWEALKVWNRSPNLINRRIFGVKLFDVGEQEDLTIFNEAVRSCFQNDSDFITKYFNEVYERTLVNKFDESNSLRNNKTERFRLFLKILLHRKDNDGYEVSLFDIGDKSGVFIEALSRSSVYSLRYRDDRIEFRITDEALMTDTDWCTKTLLPKFVKWMSNNSGAHISSLSLVPIDLYKELYSSLKTKYTSNILKIWTEVTDPEKFIHEDIAIATYLLLLWRGRPPQRYVDLGCGNGLLVHILNSESHLGTGFDLRARTIWSKYPSSTLLKVEKIKPSKNQMFEEVDWVIGNHSDELTPWIPVIATYNSPHCNFFLLPCCAFNFDGSKFRRSNSSRSQYSDYLDYVENLCVECGFNVARDKLRIPSTKRICFVSSGRCHDLEKFKEYKQSIDDLIENSSKPVVNQMQDWKIEVKLRESEEVVKNCTQIDSGLKQGIVNLIAGILLKDYPYSKNWNEGNPTKLIDIIQHLPEGYLKELKAQGKGVQTLIKNHHHIFKLENGFVTFRKPEISLVKTERWKTKPCWFFTNHPNSCPLSHDNCAFKHSINEVNYQQT